MKASHSFVFAFLCFIGMTLAAPRPHTGMINDDRFRDVGAIYSEPGYGGGGAFLLAVKDGRECQPLYDGPASALISSVTFSPF